jgi:seryl-tRNA synthetase
MIWKMSMLREKQPKRNIGIRKSEKRWHNMQEVKKMSEGERLRKEAREATKELQRIENQHRSALLTVEELSHQLTKARANANKAEYLVQRAGVNEEPPVPSFDQMLKMATQARPDLNRNEVLAQVASVHSALTSAYVNQGARFGDAHNNPPTMEGEEVRDMNKDKQHYELPPTDKMEGLPKFVKVYPNEEE